LLVNWLYIACQRNTEVSRKLCFDLVDRILLPKLPHPLLIRPSVEGYL